MSAFAPVFRLARFRMPCTIDLVIPVSRAHRFVGIPETVPAAPAEESGLVAGRCLPDFRLFTSRTVPLACYFVTNPKKLALTSPTSCSRSVV
jgi:hypothetical protein